MHLALNEPLNTLLNNNNFLYFNDIYILYLNGYIKVYTFHLIKIRTYKPTYMQHSQMPAYLFSEII